MSLISLIIYLVIIGVALYVIETYVPMSAPIKLLIRVVIVLLILLWILQLIGFVGPTIPRLK